MISVLYLYLYVNIKIHRKGFVKTANRDYLWIEKD